VKVEGAVVDASPLIVLCRAGLIDLLPRLFPEILVPGTVWAEIGAGAASDPAALQLPIAPWAKRVWTRRLRGNGPGFMAIAARP
jgi:predicted nucleic acid-binding protein